MADFAGLLVLVPTGVVMLVVPVLQAARANDRDLARLKDYVVLRRAHQAGNAAKASSASSPPADNRLLGNRHPGG